ncbi:MAG: hypothetical protein WC650_06100 [Candidatus Doudnabacteria bacterium]
MQGTNVVIDKSSWYWGCGNLLFSKAHFKKEEVLLIYGQVESVVANMPRWRRIAGEDDGAFLVKIGEEEFYVYIVDWETIELPDDHSGKPIRTNNQENILNFHLIETS